MSGFFSVSQSSRELTGKMGYNASFESFVGA